MVGQAPLAVGLAMPFMPSDGPLQVGQDLLLGGECLALHAVHVPHRLCFSLLVVREGSENVLSKMADSLLLLCSCAQHLFVLQLSQEGYSTAFVLQPSARIHKVTVLYIAVKESEPEENVTSFPHSIQRLRLLSGQC